MSRALASSPWTYFEEGEICKPVSICHPSAILGTTFDASSLFCLGSNQDRLVTSKTSCKSDTPYTDPNPPTPSSSFPAPGLFSSVGRAFVLHRTATRPRVRGSISSTYCYCGARQISTHLSGHSDCIATGCKLRSLPPPMSGGVSCATAAGRPDRGHERNLPIYTGHTDRVQSAQLRVADRCHHLNCAGWSIFRPDPGCGS